MRSKSEHAAHTLAARSPGLALAGPGLSWSDRHGAFLVCVAAFGERGWRLGMKWKNASVGGVVVVVGLQLAMEQAKRSRAKRHGAREGGRSLSSAIGAGGRGEGFGGWALGPGQEALQSRSGSTWTLDVLVSSTSAAL